MTQPSETPFIKQNAKSQYGKQPLESWVGTIVSYDAQKSQIQGGWGWRYKVRIMGDHYSTDGIEDQQLDFAYALLPTTAGSGGAYKLRSVRISQGDFVYGIRGGNGPTLIIGVFPRTKGQSAGSSSKFSNVSGFYGSLKKNKTLNGEFNEQIGPKTPGTSPLNKNKSNRDDSTDKIDGYEGNVAVPKTPVDQPWDGTGNPITTGQVSFILDADKGFKKDQVQHRTEAVNQALAQNLVDEDVAKEILKLIKKNNRRSLKEANRLLLGLPTK